MKPRLTEWFAGTAKPALPGVYERSEPAAFCGNYSYFDGSKWGVSSNNPDVAESRKVLSSVWQDIPWRGLAEDPSASLASHDTQGTQGEKNV